MGYSKGGGKSGGKGGGKGQTARAEPPMPREPVERSSHVVHPDVPWPLLPCEEDLVPLLATLASAPSRAQRDDAILEVLRAHPWVEAKGKPGGGPAADLGGRIGAFKEEHFRLSLGAFRGWLKKPEGRGFAEGAGGPSDDGIYTLSGVLRRCMPRGFSLFTFGAEPTQVIVRGFRKFTGLTATDEDEESGATDHCEDFYLAPRAEASVFAVTTKSNGENGKFTVREVAGELVLFAGSKNTCLAWRAEDDVAVMHPAADLTVPGPFIAAKMQQFWRGWSEDVRIIFAERIAEADGGLTLMLEHNSAHHEHVFPIPEDFVEFVAVLDGDGLPLPQRQAFALFDEFHLPRVRCENGLPMALLPERQAEERAATDREGAVLYLETTEGAPVALVKIKSDFYVKARRTRQIFWSCLVDPILRGEDLDGEVGDGKRSNKGWAGAEGRMRTGMKELKHIGGNAQHWQEWADVATGFVHWWRRRFEGAASDGDRKKLAKEGKDKFGTVYRDYCREVGLPGGDN